MDAMDRKLESLWGFLPKTTCETGYEDCMEQLKSYTTEDYAKATPEEEERMVNEVLAIYRSKNLYPIRYYSHQGVIEEIRKCMEKNIVWNDVLDFKYNQGQSLGRFLFPNMFRIVVRSNPKNTLYNRFMNDHLLKKAIRFGFKFKTGVLPSEIAGSLQMIGGGFGMGFKAMNTKALVERFCPKEGTMYDFACGFGGRMLGTLCSINNYKYIGVEPCTETYGHLQLLGQLIEEATGRCNSYELHCIGSEDFKGEPSSVDFAFSSPPYFDLEQYSEEDTQCYIKYPDIDSWMEGYVKATLENIYYMMKDNRYYAVNIADFNIGKNQRVDFVDRWLALSEQVGFQFIKKIPMMLEVRRGDGHKVGTMEIDKSEFVYLFAKCKKEDIDKLPVYSRHKLRQRGLFG